MELKAPATAAERRIYDDLVANGIVWPMDAKGVLGYGEIFEDVLARFNRLIDALATPEGARTRAFPPILSREVLRRQGYIESFAHQCG
jgi:hypothetical protein